MCKIAAAIKCGELSLVHSYRYLSIDAYLIPEKYWEEHKIHLIEKLGLTQFVNIESILPMLRGILDKQFMDVNQRIVEGTNKYVTIKNDGGFAVFKSIPDKKLRAEVYVLAGTY